MLESAGVLATVHRLLYVSTRRAPKVGGPGPTPCRAGQEHRDDKENGPPQKQYQWLNERGKDGAMRAGEDDDAEEADGRQHGERKEPGGQRKKPTHGEG